MSINIKIFSDSGSDFLFIRFMRTYELIIY